jgi:hypothetical protein
VDATIKILILAGSLRRDSYNRSLARAAAQISTSGVSTETFDGLGAIPFYDGDLEDEGLPATVIALRRAIVEADALLLATPEYNGATSGVLKNALDWASRGPERILAGKTVAVMGRPPAGVVREVGSSRSCGSWAARVRTCSTVSSPFRSRPERSTTTWPWRTRRSAPNSPRWSPSLPTALVTPPPSRPDGLEPARAADGQPIGDRTS